jgi:uncharacterized membrane protein
MNRFPLRKVVVAGIMSAIAIFLGATGLGFISWFAGVSITIMMVPVIIAAVLEGPVVGLAVGFLFGIFSLIQAAVAPKSPLDPLFVYPWLSVLPRLFIGPVAWLVYAGIRRLKLLGKARTVIGLVVAGVAGSLTNTVLVLGVLGVFYLGYTDWLTWPWIGSIVVANGLPEAAAAAILTLAVVGAWQGIEYGRRRSRLVDEGPAEALEESE